MRVHSCRQYILLHGHTISDAHCILIFKFLLSSYILLKPIAFIKNILKMDYAVNFASNDCGKKGGCSSDPGEANLPENIALTFVHNRFSGRRSG